MPTNPIQYTSKTFDAILQDINNDTELVDKPNWFKRLIAGVGDVISMWNNALANNLLLRTAYTRRAVQLLLELIDYDLVSQSTATGILLFYVDSGAGYPFTVTAANLVGLTAGTSSVSSKRFEARADVTFTDVNETFTATFATDILNVARVYTTGEKVRLSTTNTLPDPLQTATDYWVIYVSDTTIRLATSLANAYLGTYITLTDAGLGVHTITLYSKQVTVYQQQSKDSYVIGGSDGVTEWQEFDLSDLYVLEDTLEITVNAVTWTKVDTFVDSGSTDKHYRIFYNEDGYSRIQFGNGTYGEIPGNFDIYAEYAYGGGSDSNVTVVNKINIYAGSDSNIVGVSNPASLTGGDDPEDIESAKILAPLLLKTRDRFITAADGEALCLAYGGVSQVEVIENAFGILSARVLCIATGGGNLSAGVKAALQAYLIDRTVLESIDVRVEDVTITTVAVTSAAKMLSGYVWADVQPLFRLAWKLFWSEAGKEIQDDYISNGVDSARVLINTIFTEAYTSSDNAQIIRFLDNLDPREIGVDIEESDAFAFVAAHTFGVDYMTIAAPAFPVSVAADEITTYGALTLTEI